MLGYPITDETGTPDGIGRFNHFTNGGSIYWTPWTGAHAIYGAIRAQWAATGWEHGPNGYPTSDEVTPSSGTGRFNSFQNGAIYWSARSGAWEVVGAINGKYVSLGATGSFLGFPQTNECTTPDGIGRYNHFQNGSIYWTAALGPHFVSGAIRAAWAAQGWERGRLGYPVSDEYSVAGGRRSDFQHGWIFWNSSNGAITVSVR